MGLIKGRRTPTDPLPKSASLEEKAEQCMEQARQTVTRFNTVAGWYSRSYYGLSFISIIGAAIVAGIINIPQVPKFYPTTISIIVASATGIIGFFHLYQRSIIARSNAASIAVEISDFDFKVGKYAHLYPEALALFQRKIISLEMRKYEQLMALEQPTHNLEQSASKSGQSANQHVSAVPEPAQKIRKTLTEITSPLFKWRKP